MGMTTFSGPVRSVAGFSVGPDPATAPQILQGSGPPLVSAPKGTLYINVTGTDASTRILINTNGATGWTPLTAGA